MQLYSLCSLVAETCILVIIESAEPISDSILYSK